jgi:protein-L-isoaspartate(D-aspartate) O-methyltransferase
MSSPQEMIQEMKEGYGLDAPEIFSVMLRIPREKFVPSEYQKMAYEDEPIPIGFGQTISQPYTVAFMTNLLNLTGKESVLEIGTGSGYQAAILSLLAKRVHTIEIIPELAKEAKQRLKKMGYKNVEVREGSGEFGWKEKGPFEAIIVTAGVEEVPKALFDQLKDNGVLVAPFGGGIDKQMTKFTKLKGGKIKKEEYGIFHFVPFVESN